MPSQADILELAVPLVESNIKKEFQAQGHHLTGAWEQSISSVKTENRVEGYAKSYGSIVDAGMTPDKIPFGGTSTKSGLNSGIKSQYIQGLTRFWMLRKPGISEKEALRLAFATANVQKQEGMSTAASYRFSQTGQRQKFIEAVKRAITPEVDNIITKGFDKYIEAETRVLKEITY